MANSTPNLADMFRSAGINDVQTYVDEVKQETRDLDNYQLSSPTTSTSTSASKKNHGKMIMANAKQIYQFYKSMDKNGDGKITVEDVEILLKELGLGFVSKHLARAIFDLVDTNHNGELEFRDLVALVSILKELTSSSSSSSTKVRL